jgi:uncharacterized protein YdeI (YjbR/CyaY-like superfamily)
MAYGSSSQKKESGVVSVSKREAIDGALCYGWIDGQLDKFDDRFWLVRYSAVAQEQVVPDTRPLRDGKMNKKED